jgi:hypothetical protein
MSIIHANDKHFSARCLRGEKEIFGTVAQVPGKLSRRKISLHCAPISKER